MNAYLNPVYQLSKYVFKLKWVFHVDIFNSRCDNVEGCVEVIPTSGKKITHGKETTHGKKTTHGKETTHINVVCTELQSHCKNSYFKNNVIQMLMLENFQ